MSQQDKSAFGMRELLLPPSRASFPASAAPDHRSAQLPSQSHRSRLPEQDTDGYDGIVSDEKLPVR